MWQFVENVPGTAQFSTHNFFVIFFECSKTTLTLRDKITADTVIKKEASREKT